NDDPARPFQEATISRIVPPRFRARMGRENTRQTGCIMKSSAHFHDFRSLSVKDLLEVRDAYHVHLAHLDNVYATAIGRYLIRDEDSNAKDAHHRTDRKSLGARTLLNSSPKD